MNAEALVLVITGALLHALWNLAAKKASGGLAFVFLFGLVSLLAALPFALLASSNVARQLTLPAIAAILASGLIHVVYSLVLQAGYRASDFSLVYPVARGSGPLFAVFGAVLFLGEAPSWLGWCGIGAVIGGIVLISGAGRAFFAPTARLRAGIAWGGATGACIAAYTVIDGWAIKTLGMNPLLYYFLGLAVRALALAPIALRDRPGRLEIAAQWRANRRHIVVVGVLSPLAYTLILFALTKAPLSYVAPVRELSMLVGVLFGARWLNERLTPSRAVGTVFMLAGVVMLARA